MTNPWDRNAGKYDRPSSAVPVSRFVAQAIDANHVRAEKTQDAELQRQRAQASRAKFLERVCADAVRDGVVPIGIASLLERIDAAIAKLKANGFGEPTSIYLTDSDLLAWRALECGWEYAGARIDRGKTSKVYSKRGSRAIRRPSKAKR